MESRFDKISTAVFSIRPAVKTLILPQKKKTCSSLHMSAEEVKRSRSLTLKAGMRALVNCILDWFVHAQLVNSKSYRVALIPFNPPLQSFPWAT